MEKETKMFEDFVKNYDLTIPQLNEKHGHTYRVLGYAKEIAKSLDFNEEDVNKACICGLFHDLGRFPQFSEFHTFHDRDSFDHGDKSYEILKELNYNDNIVLNAVKYHNKYKIADDLTDREKVFANITRDADKIDIILMQTTDEYKENYKITDELMNYFKNGNLVPNNFDDTTTINRLRCLAFMFDVNFKKSYEIIKESNIVNKIADVIYNATGEKKIFEIRDIINERIEEHVR